MRRLVPAASVPKNSRATGRGISAKRLAAHCLLIAAISGADRFVALFGWSSLSLEVDDRVREALAWEPEPPST